MAMEPCGLLLLGRVRIGWGGLRGLGQIFNVLAWWMGSRDSGPQEDEEPLKASLTLAALRSPRLLVLGLDGEDLDSWRG